MEEKHILLMNKSISYLQHLNFSCCQSVETVQRSAPSPGLCRAQSPFGNREIQTGRLGRAEKGCVEILSAGLKNQLTDELRD